MEVLNATQIPMIKTWVEFDFQDIIVTPGDTYYIVWKPVGIPDCNNNTYWCIGANNPYINGFPWITIYTNWVKFNPINFQTPISALNLW
jgi:hypothetical protein